MPGILIEASEYYFFVPEDLFPAYKIPVFSRRTKRRLVALSKFYYFDAGVYRTLKSKSPLDSPEDI